MHFMEQHDKLLLFTLKLWDRSLTTSCIFEADTDVEIWEFKKRKEKIIGADSGTFYSW